MKKKMMIAAMMVAALTASAQDDNLKNEIGIYYGFGSASDIVSTVATAMSTPFSSSDQNGFWGPVGVEYYYHVTPCVGVGAMASIAGCKWGNDSENKTKYYTVMPAVKFNWLRKTYFGMYSGLAAGVMIVSDSYKSESKSKAFFMGHVTALGAEFGGEQLRGFTELGFGERGLLTLGLRYKF